MSDAVQADAAVVPVSTTAPALVPVRLSIMMFLQYAIWGAWASALALHLETKLNFSAGQIGAIFGALWLACIFAPLIGGQIVDRWMPTQLFLALAHLVGAVLLYETAIQTTFQPMWGWMFAYSILYAPTLALTNSICFHKLRDPERQFGRIRLWGTAGWIVAGLAVSAIRGVWNSDAWVNASDLLIIAAVLSVIMGLYCFSLPHTPPRRESRNPLAFLEAISMLKNRNFLIFMLISFVVTTELQFYYIPTANFLEARGASGKAIPALMTLAQVAEILVLLLLLHISLKHLGVRKTMMIGILAWPVRYLLFMVPSLAVIIPALTLHGFGYAFFFVASQIYVNAKARDDMRASAQALLTLFTLGIGNYLGTLFTGWVWGVFQTNGQTNWTAFFLVPSAITIACAFAFVVFFRDDVRVSERELETV